MDVPPQYEAEGTFTFPPANTNILQFNKKFRTHHYTTIYIKKTNNMQQKERSPKCLLGHALRY